MKRAATQINNIATSKAASLSDSNKSTKITFKKKARNGVRFKQQWKKTLKQHSSQRSCVLFNKLGIYEQNYMLHNSEYCFGKRSDQKFVKKGLGGGHSQ